MSRFGGCLQGHYNHTLILQELEVMPSAGQNALKCTNFIVNPFTADLVKALHFAYWSNAFF